MSIDRESVQVCMGNRRHSVLAGFITRGQSWQNMAWIGDKKAFCVLEFAKMESIVTVKRWFRTCTGQNDLQAKQFVSGCLCTAKQTGQLGPSAEIVKHVQETFVTSPQRLDILSTCMVGQKFGVSLPLFTCSAPAWPFPATVLQRLKTPEGLMNYPV